MFDVILYAANGVLPLMALIFLGYLLRKVRFFDELFLKQGNKLLFRVILPTLVVTNIYSVSGLSAIPWRLVIFAVSAVLVLFVIGLTISLLFVPEKACRGVLIQCAFRSNFAIIGVPLSASLGGKAGTAITAILLAFIIPCFNILAVVSLSLFSEGEKKSWKKILTDICKNPLIIAAVIGLLLLLLRSLIPLGSDGNPVFSLQRDLKFLYDAMEMLGDCSNGLALVILGGLLDFSQLRGKLRLIALGTVSRVLMAPAIGLTAAVLLTKAGILSCGSAEYASLIALFGSPVAVSSAIMAAEMHADDELARQLVVWTSLCPIVTVFLIVVLFRSMGLL